MYIQSSVSAKDVHLRGRCVLARMKLLNVCIRLLYAKGEMPISLPSLAQGQVDPQVAQLGMCAGFERQYPMKAQPIITTPDQYIAVA